MNRPWQIWVLFALSLAVVLAAMGWVSLTALRLDRAEAEARRVAAREENVRLALWRMDSALAPVIARENVRPYFSYSAFYPAQRAYTRMYAEIQTGDVLIPSPLLTFESPLVLLHFQIGPDGRMTSPQVPTSNMRDLAELSYTTQEKIEAAAALLADLEGLLSRKTLAAALTADNVEQSASEPQSAQQYRQEKVQQVIDEQQAKNVVEWRRRGVISQPSARQQVETKRPPTAAARATDGLIKPLWIGEALLLVRKVSVNGKSYLQGCRLNWPAIQQWLLEDVRDLLPDAELQPVAAAAGVRGERMLAALPVKLSPGDIPVASAGGGSPILLSLSIAWGCMLVAAMAVAALLLGAVTLSERRAAFVSSVTHELRTPLTTFRMYTEMLSEGMVPEGEKRRRYLATLCAEAERLSHLVENVLSYARLERGRAGSAVETLSLRDLLDGMKRRLAERAQQAEMELVVEIEPAAASATVRTDASAVEQVLFNRVDNACK